LSSTTSTSPQPIAARASALLAACTGAIAKMSGSTACVPRLTNRASGSPETLSSPISSAPAPSVSGDEFPAVTVPSATKAGFKPDSFSFVVSRRRFSSWCSSVSGTGITHVS
jgi:hypothetical protein